MILIEKTLNPCYLKIRAEKAIFVFLQMHFTVRDPNAFYSPLFRNKHWDGKIRFLRADGAILSGLLVEILRVAKINKWSVKFDRDLIVNTHKFQKAEIESSLKGVTLFPDQFEVIEKMLKYCTGLCKLPTSSGKSYIEIAMMNLYRARGFKNLILIVPRETLGTQIYDDITTKSSLIKPEEVGRLYGGLKEWERPVVVATWQSLNKLIQLDKDFGKRFELLIQDEVHVSSSQAKVTREIITSFPTRFKYGFSATILDRQASKLEYFNSIGIFGPITATNTIKSLQEDNRISAAEINVKLLHYTPQPEIKDYQEYEKFIRYSPKRREYIVKLVKEIKNNMPDSNGLLLIRNVDFAREMAEILREYFDENVHLIEGSTKSDDRTETKKIIQLSKNQILIATTGVFSMGENLPNLHWLILVQSRKSEIESIQQVGRLLRIFPGKEKAVIYDLCDDIILIKTTESGSTYKKNFGKNHLKKRIKVFTQHGLNVKNIEQIFL